MRVFWRVWLLQNLMTTELLQMCWSLSVRFINKEPIYVAVGRTLVLRAQFDQQPGEIVSYVTWDLRDLKKDTEIRLVTDNKPTDGRISVDEGGALLKMTDITSRDSGYYVVTITDRNGDQTYDSVEVRLIEKTPEPQFSLECTRPTQGAQWDSSVYSWWVDGVEVTNQTANLSADHSRLYLSGGLGKNYTCIIDSSQGTSRAQNVKELDPEPTTHHNTNTALTVFLVIETIVIFVLSWMLYRTKKKSSSRP